VENGSSRTVHPELKEVLYRAGSLQGLDDTRARAFLSSRGFADFADALTRARVRFAPDFGRKEATEEKGAYRGAPALVFPISDDAGQLVAFQGRKTDPGDGLKVLTFGPKTSGLFWGPGSREAFQKGEALAICEAPLDALSLSVCQVPAVALCGSSRLPEFLLRGCFNRRYWLAFDADEAGDKASDVIAAELKGKGALVSRLRPSEAKDWNEALQAGGAVWDREATKLRGTAAALLPYLGSEAKATTAEGSNLRRDTGERSGGTQAKHSKSTGTGTTEHDFMEGPQKAAKSLPEAGNPMLVSGYGNPILSLPETGNPMELSESGKSHGAIPELRQLEQVGAENKLTEVIAWACSEAHRGFLPEPAEALPLPSGNVVPANGAAAWLIAAESRSEGLEIHSHTSIDCTLALGIVRRDMEAIAIWARHARLWQDAPYTHEGACCLLPAPEEELQTLAAGLEWT
jgi:hypothetical protein